MYTMNPYPKFSGCMHSGYNFNCPVENYHTRELTWCMNCDPKYKQYVKSQKEQNEQKKINDEKDQILNWQKCVANRIDLIIDKLNNLSLKIDQFTSKKQDDNFVVKLETSVKEL